MLADLPCAGQRIEPHPTVRRFVRSAVDQVRSGGGGLLPLTALRRAADAGRLDFNRIAVLRTASNFDRPHDGQNTAESLGAKSGGFGPATQNAFLAGNALAQDIITHWDRYEAGLKK